MDLVPKNVHVDKIDENGSSVNTEHWNRLLKKDLTPQVPSNLPNKALFRFSKNLFGQTNNEIMVIGCSTERSASRLYIYRADIVWYNTGSFLEAEGKFFYLKNQRDQIFRRHYRCKCPFRKKSRKTTHLHTRHTLFGFGHNQFFQSHFLGTVTTTETENWLHLRAIDICWCSRYGARK